MLAFETFRGRDADICCLRAGVDRWLLIDAAQNRCCAVENSRLSYTGQLSARASLPRWNRVVMSAMGCHFNRSMQHMRQIVLPVSRSLTFSEVAR